MSALLAPQDYSTWLDHEETERSPVHLLRPYDRPGLIVHEAHPKVGNVRNQNIDMLDSL
jgi:putative SOS response-associated peptidase YedK